MSDLHAVLRIDRTSDRDSELGRFLASKIQQEECFLAEDKGSVVGTLILTYHFFSQGFIELVIIDREHQRRGIGTALMRFAESQCKTSKLFSSTNLSNQPMMNLFSSLGYIESGVIENLDDGDPEIVYFKPITPGAI